MHLQSQFFKLLFAASLSTIVLFGLLKQNSTHTIIATTTISTTLKPNDTKFNAFIITASCNSRRFNATKSNLEDHFPNFFRIHCFLTIPLNDSRIHTSNVRYWKLLSSNLLTFIQLWMYVIPGYSKDNPYQWSFVFEDDVNFLNASRFYLPNYLNILQELMNNRQIRYDDGFFYLGICGPEYFNRTPPIFVKNTNESLICKKGYGYCLHATAITAKRSRLFWTEIASYRPISAELSLDHQLRQYSIRSQKDFYILGSNFEFPPLEEHYGIAYQDRGRFISTVIE